MSDHNRAVPLVGEIDAALRAEGPLTTAQLAERFSVPLHRMRAEMFAGVNLGIFDRANDEPAGYGEERFARLMFND